MRLIFCVLACLGVIGTTVETALAQAAPSGETIDLAKETLEADGDLQVRQFYNKPGATLAEYHRDWLRCRLIADGAVSPYSGASIDAYVQHGVVGGVTANLMGSFLASLGRQKQRRDNRRTCLLVSGWRHVSAPSREAEKVAALASDARAAYLAARIGAANVDGSVEAETPQQLRDPVLNPDAPVTQPAQVTLGNPDSGTIALGEDEAAVAVVFRRTDKASVGRWGAVLLAAYDRTSHELIERTKLSEAMSGSLPFEQMIASPTNTGQYEIVIRKVRPGDYVMRTMGPRRIFDLGFSAGSDDNCLGTPVFNVPKGKIVYVGDFTPYVGLKLSNGDWLDTQLTWTFHFDGARDAIVRVQPSLAQSLQPADVRNGATYRCVAEAIETLVLDGRPSMDTPQTQ